MAEKAHPGPMPDAGCVREAVCLDTRKIFDSCRDKDCLEDLRLYPTQESQSIIERAVSVKAGKAQLLYVYIDVEPVGFNRGFYTVDLRYYYRVTADAFVGAVHPVEISGLCVFDKRVILYGSESGAKVFSSEVNYGGADHQLHRSDMPTAVVEAVDPVVLGVKLVDVCECRPCCCCDCELTEVPPCICGCFGCDLCFGNDCKRVYVSLGQFSIIRLERDAQVVVPMLAYSIPTKECCDSGGCTEDPCEMFAKIPFPAGQFSPRNCDQKNDCKPCRTC